MKTLLPILLLASGCSLPGGWDLTPGSVSCGVHPKSGMDVYVDGTGIDPNVGNETGYSNLPDGGTQLQYAGAPYMTCDQAFKTIDQAIAIGNLNGFWVGNDEDSYGFLRGVRLEFIDAYNLKAIGKVGSDGLTVDYLGLKEMAVNYEYDQQANVDYNSNPAPNLNKLGHIDPGFNPAATWPSAVILVHEMTHALQASGFMNLGDLNGGETSSGGHCNWSKTYAYKYANLGWAGYSSNFDDTCQHMQCSGASCTPDSSAPKTN